MKIKNLKKYLLEFPNFLSMFLFSFFMMLASPILMDISKYFNVSPENMNLIITFFMIGEVTGILALIFLKRRFNNFKVIIITYVLLIPTLAGLSLVRSLILFYILYYVSGCLFGIIFMNSNTSMLEGRVKNKDSIVNLGHGFFAVGALTSPVFASSLIDRNANWRVIYIVVIGLALVSLISYLVTYKKKQVGILIEDRVPLKKFFIYRDKNIYMALTAVLMLFYVMSEVTIFSWAPTFFRIEKLFDLYSASLIVSVFWIGILVGRLLISFLSYKYKAGTLLIVLSVISVIGLAIAIIPSNQIINFVGVGLIGLGFSGIPPLLISSAGRIFGSGKDLSLTILFVIGIASGSLIPFAIRSIADFSFLFSIAIAIIFMFIFFIFVLIRKSYRKNIKTR